MIGYMRSDVASPAEPDNPNRMARTAFEASLPRAAYVDEAFLQLERERLWWSEWIAVGREEQGIAKPAFLQQRQVGGEQGLERLFGIGPGDGELAHMADVEQAGVAPGPEMLGHDAFILDRHLIAGEGHHPPAMRAVCWSSMRACIVTTMIWTSRSCLDPTCL